MSDELDKMEKNEPFILKLKLNLVLIIISYKKEENLL
jgi:hypothetical protein